MSEFDLTKKISSFLDKHLTLPLLEYISVKNVSHSESFIARYMMKKAFWRPNGKFSWGLLWLIMPQILIEVYTKQSLQKVWPDYSSYLLGLLDKREKVLESIQETEVKLKPVKVIFSQETMKEVAQCKNAKDLLTSLETKYNFKTEMLNDMFDAARVSWLL